MARRETICFGELIPRRRLLARGWIFTGPGILWLTIFLLIPCLLLTALAFATRGSYGEIIFFDRDDAGRMVWQLTLGNFKKLAGFGIFGWSPDYLRILLRTVWMASVTTTISIALAYPIAFFIAARSRKWRTFWLIIVIIPFCTNLVIRTYAWQLLLSPNSPLARIAGALGLITHGDALYPSRFAVYLGMVSSSLSFAVLPLHSNVERLDWSIVEASQDLYASPYRVFRHGILPQTIPGLAVAVIITFIPSLGTFLVSDLLGGAKEMLIGNLIEQQFGASRDFPFGATVSLVLVVATLIALYFYQRRGREAQFI